MLKRQYWFIFEYFLHNLSSDIAFQCLSNLPLNKLSLGQICDHYKWNVRLIRIFVFLYCSSIQW